MTNVVALRAPAASTSEVVLAPHVPDLLEAPLTGNLIPHAWYRQLTFANGKADVNAILILADIVYWYRPAVRRDAESGAITACRPKFHGALLQKSYHHYSQLLGLSKRQVAAAMARLEQRGLIQRQFRRLTTPHQVLHNVLFIAIDVPRLTALSQGDEQGDLMTGRSSEGPIPAEKPLACAAQLPAAVTTAVIPVIEPRVTAAIVSHSSCVTISASAPIDSVTSPVPVDGLTATISCQDTIPLPISPIATTPVLAVQMLTIWQDILQPARPVLLSLARAAQLTAVLQDYFSNDLGQWQQCCQLIRQTPFLMGQGARGWHISLDWLLRPVNLTKILAGHYAANPAASALSMAVLPEICPSVPEIVAGADPQLQQLTAALLKFVPVATYQRWLSGLQIATHTGGQLTVALPDRASCQYVQRHLSSELRAAAITVFAGITWVDCMVQPAQPKILAEDSSPPPAEILAPLISPAMPTHYQIPNAAPVAQEHSMIVAKVLLNDPTSGIKQLTTLTVSPMDQLTCNDYGHRPINVSPPLAGLQTEPASVSGPILRTIPEHSLIAPDVARLTPRCMPTPCATDPPLHLNVPPPPSKRGTYPKITPKMTTQTLTQTARRSPVKLLKKSFRTARGSSQSPDLWHTRPFGELSLSSHPLPPPGVCASFSPSINNYEVYHESKPSDFDWLRGQCPTILYHTAR